MRWGAVAVAVLLVLPGCALFRPRPEPPPVVSGVQVGVASWYGPGFHGRPTASGEIFDQHALTAAHPSLRLGTRARVTSLTNDRSVDVRVNDRGPFVGGRIVDLSFAAAQRLGMIGPGVMRVRLEVLEPAGRERAARPAPRRTEPARREVARRDTAPPPPPPADGPAGWVVQSGAFRERAGAESAHREIARRFPEAYVAPVAGDAPRSFGVRLGPYEARRSAEARAEIVTRLGYPSRVFVEPAP